MKNIFFIIVILGMCNISLAQNTFPSSGNAGVGVTSPASKLEIYSGAVTTIGALNNLGLFISGGGYNGNVLQIGFGYGTNYAPAAIGHIVTTQSGNTNGALFFATRRVTTDSAPSERMRIDADGNVGIGTNTPLAKLHLGSDNQEIRFDYSGAYYYGSLRFAGLQLGNNGPNRIVAGRSSSGGQLDFYVNNTNDAADYNVTPDGILAMRIGNSGNVGIGTTTPSEKLSVNGRIQAKEIKVETGWSDFVFDRSYKLADLKETEQFIKANKHLPEIPSAKEVAENGINLGEMNAKLLQKIEELTLYLIDKEKKIDFLEQKAKELDKQQLQINDLLQRLKVLEK